MRDELAEWRKSYANLKEEKEKLYKEMPLAVQGREQKIRDLQQENKELLSYIECLEKKKNLQNKG